MGFNPDSKMKGRLNMANISDFDNMDERQSREDVTVKLAGITGTQDYTVEAGTTVGDFKEMYDLEGKKLVSRTRGVLTDSDVIQEDEVVFVSMSKENGVA